MVLWAARFFLLLQNLGMRICRMTQRCMWRPCRPFWDSLSMILAYIRYGSKELVERGGLPGISLGLGNRH